jgi:paraquat-inducible protein A
LAEHGPILPGERECHDCGLFQTMPPLRPGDAACCGRCGATLRRGRRDSLTRALACALGALLLFVVALQLPLMDVRTVGRFYQAGLFTGPAMLDKNGMWAISAVVLFTLVAMPALQLGLILTVLIGLRTGRLGTLLPVLFGYLERIRPWSMIEVFLLGSFVAYTRLQAIAEVQVGPGLLALGGVMLCLIGADAVLDHDAVWEELAARHLVHVRPPPPTDRPIGCDCCRLVLYAPSGWPCPRCGRALRHRKRQSLLRSWAFLSAATALYVPANLYPIITVIRFGQGEPSTIWQGVVELIDAHMWPLALLVFLASLTVPLMKLTGMTAMLLMTQHGSAAWLPGRARLFRVIDGVGRWSMIDVFMLTVLVALVHIGFVATVLPGSGAVAFAAVVVLTMLGAATFDPRLMWDAAAAAGHTTPAARAPRDAGAAASR